MFFARYADAILGTVLVLLSGLLLTVLIPIGVQLPKSNRVLALSPDFWMKIIIWSTLALGVFILIKGIGKARHNLDPGEIAHVAEQMKHRHPPARAILGGLTTVAGLFIYYFAILWIGMIAASILAVICFTLLCGERRFKIMIPLAVLLPIGLYYFFLKAASIPMPLGVFS